MHVCMQDCALACRVALLEHMHDDPQLRVLLRRKDHFVLVLHEPVRARMRACVRACVRAPVRARTRVDAGGRHMDGEIGLDNQGRV